ncbi:LamG-like jellyroll fold domain-containing protein [Aureispira anguillae]|uniref:Lamin tail domain-containing protein n=1 Tax=Aureispira anguillae TaxID=2864201 RepID=A0A915YLF8_9BACT|nr:LamG-like jellyroll fold domain-containing protein [Aureispira anguillae]BDS15389.1 lamin tail domain-containing protein [Aureispira anguillae]
MNKLFHTTLILLSWIGLFSHYSNAQTIDWAGSIAASNHNIEPYAIAQDANQDIYVVGRFRETADFNMGAGTANLTSTGNYDAFIAKYDLNGNYIWAFNLGTTGTGKDTRAYDITVDALGNVIVVGEFKGAGVNFAPLGGVATSLTSSTAGSDPDGFAAKYNSAGQCIWAMQFGAGTLNNEIYGVATDPSNNIYIAGRLDDNDATNATAINVNPLGAAHSMNTNGADIVLIKYNANGLHLWDASIGSSGNLEYAYGVEVSGANLYLTGEFQGTAEFNPLGTSIQRTSLGSYDGFVAQYDAATGVCNWANRFGGTGSDEARKATVDAAGAVYLTGLFYNTVDFDPSGGTYNISSSGSSDIFVAKYTSSGTHAWAFPIGGASLDYGYDIDIDGTNLYVTGKFRGTADFDPSANTANLTSAGSATMDEAFIGKYTNNGVYVNAFSIEGAGHDRGYGIVVNNGSIHLTGYFEGMNVDFDPIGTATLNSASGTTYNDGFIAIYSDVVPTPEVAIIEWLANPTGIESEEEWVEIYNYGSAPINLKDWKLKDEDTDNATISAVDLFLSAGESLILARNKAKFEEHWLKGCANDKVVQVSMDLENDADELILEDNNGTIIWSIAYDDDETEGRATYYTELTYANTNYGSKAIPGVNRTGNDVTGSLGYQRNNTTVDVNAFANDIGDIGSPIYNNLMDYNRGNTVIVDGVDDYIDLGAQIALENQSEFTFEAWVKPLTIDANTERIFSKRLNNTNRIEISLGSGGTEATNQYLKISICNGTSESANASNLSVPVGEWTHIAVVFNGAATAGNRLKFYANGIAQTLSSDPVATTTPSGTGNAHLGKRSDNANKPSNVELDEVRLWNSARSEQLVRENMHLTLTGCETGLVAYYQLNETTGTVANDVLANNNATLMNGASRNSSPINVGNSAASISQTITGIATTGVHNFATAHLEINFTSKTGTEDITVTYEGFSPNTNRGTNGVAVYDNPTWTVNSSTTTGAYIGDLTFTFPTGTFSSTNPLQYRLYHRAMHASDDWKEIANAVLVTGNTITFPNIEVWGQFMVVQQSIDGISPVRGNMYTFDGIDDYIDVTTTASGLPQGNSARTIEAWIKTTVPTTGNYNNILSWGRRAANLRNSIGIRNGSFSFVGEGNDLEGTIVINDNQWHHVACVFDGVTLSLYVDGVLDIATSKTLNTTDQNLVIGTIALPASGEFWLGSLDEIRIWNAARTQTEIRENMHLTLNGGEANLLTYYQFNNDDPVGTVNGVKDALGSSNGRAINMTPAAYVASEIAVAGGLAQTLTIPATGPFLANYSKVGLSINFGATAANGDVVVTRLETEQPHGGSSITGQVDNEYFVVRNYGGNTTFTVLNSLSLLDIGYISPAEAAQPESASPLKLYKRPSNAYGATWGTALANANSANSGHNGTLVFDNSAAITSFSQLVFVNSNVDLPVELIQFEAERKNADEVILNWKTASETNNQGFQVERMLAHETTFKEIGWVNGQGNSIQTNFYQFLDENSTLETSYYRLKQLDFDGTFNYSQIRAVNGQSNGKYIDWKLYPNPVINTLNVSFKQLPQPTNSIVIQVLSTDGKCLYQSQEEVQSNQTLKIDAVKKLPAGTYMFSITMGDDELLLQKFIKQ